MKLISISKEEFSDLRSEISEFITLCNENNYIPTKSEIQDILEFTITNEPSMSNIYESYQSNPEFILNHIYESYKLNEEGFRGGSEYDNSQDFKSAMGLAKVATGAAVGVAVIGGFILIQYAFKKGKVRSLVQKELDLELKKLQGYKQLAELRKKLADLKGEAREKTEYPTMATGPELEQGDSTKDRLLKFAKSDMD